MNKENNIEEIKLKEINPEEALKIVKNIIVNMGDSRIDFTEKRAIEVVLNELEIYTIHYKHLRKEWNRLVEEILGKGYYNYACDTFSCDKETADDIIYKFNHTTPLKRFCRKIKKYIKTKIEEW